MRRLISVGLALFLIWSAWWGVGAWGLNQSLNAWFEDRAQQGWQADFARMDMAGYPSRHVVTITAPALADPATGAAWSADDLVLTSPAIWPGHMTLRFPESAQRLSWLDRSADVTAQDMVADLRLHPGTTLEVETLSLRSGAWTLLTPAGDTLGGDTALLTMQQSGTDPAEYAITMQARALSPGETLRDAARLSRSLPPAFEVFTLNARVTFDKPWDRSAVETARPQPRVIDLGLAEAAWGPLRLFATGRVSVDIQGVPEGQVTIKAENWREMLALAESAGAMPPAAAEAARQSLAVLERLGGRPDRLDLDLTLRGGLITLGLVPLGPAPRLILR